MFRHAGRMVGPPKTLHDLRRVEGSVRVTCRACGAVKQHDREELIVDRHFRRLSMDWQVVLRDLPCHGCGGKDTKVDGVPFGGTDPEMRAQRARTTLMNLALRVLEDAARRSREEDVTTPALRLALRVLRLYLPDRTLLMEFWDSAAKSRGAAFSHALVVHRWIVTKLVDDGHAVWAEFR